MLQTIGRSARSPAERMPLLSDLPDLPDVPAAFTGVGARAASALVALSAVAAASAAPPAAARTGTGQRKQQPPLPRQQPHALPLPLPLPQPQPASNDAVGSFAFHGQRHLALLLTRMLDEIDYGMLLVDAGARVTYLNHAARLELDGAHPLQCTPTLGARRAADAAPLLDALAAARRGGRGMLTLGDGGQRVSMSVVPLPALEVPGVAAADASGAAAQGAPHGNGALTLLVLGKRQVCERLSVQGFARSVHLTAAETRVLELLCDGMQPTAVAEQLGVALSTVRSQINSVRAKTGARSIRDVVRQVAVLPPLVGALR